jgi:hypothetical protein
VLVVQACHRQLLEALLPVAVAVAVAAVCRVKPQQTVQAALVVVVLVQ